MQMLRDYHLPDAKIEKAIRVWEFASSVGGGGDEF